MTNMPHRTIDTLRRGAAWLAAAVVLGLAAQCPAASPTAPGGKDDRRPSQASRPAPQSTAPQEGRQAPQGTSGFTLQGFRSAEFGMNDAQVRQAIARDFPAQARDMAVERHPLQRTQALLITVPELVPESGPARVAYILGHRSKSLMQVNITWGAPANPSASARQLIDTANVLTGYLRTAGYQPDTIVTNRALADGSVLVFRGSDAQGRTTSLILRGATEGEGDRQLEPASLQLSYARDPGNPDVFRIEKGQF